jgi:predicted O-methyltransferase YrrM
VSPLRPRLARATRRVAQRLTEGELLRLDYPATADNSPRYGHGRPEHRRIAALLGRHDADYTALLDELAGHADELARIPATGAAGELHWSNGFCGGLDGIALYGLVRKHRPRCYVEVGSGYSTMFVHRARQDGQLGTHITSIDPHPRAEVDALCDVVRRSPLESDDLGVFDELRAGDIVFMDGSHRTFMNSDATVFFLDVLPELPAGVIVGVDDILLPADYPPEWADRHYSEQYLLAAYLLAETPWLRPLLPNAYVTQQLAIRARLDPVWAQPGMDRVPRSGTTFWLTIDR